MENLNFIGQIYGAEAAGNYPVWMPVIELYKTEKSDGQQFYSMEKALWLERQPGEFERREWDENLGEFIDNSGIYFKPEIIHAAESFVSLLPHPILKSMTVTYFPYTPGVCERLQVCIAVVNSLLKLSGYHQPMACDGQQFYAM